MRQLDNVIELCADDDSLVPNATPPVAVETLFRLHAGFVASFLSRLGVPSRDLEDVVQEVFMTAHCRGGYRPGAASSRSFLARIALEARLGHVRRNQRWARAETAEPSVQPSDATPEQALNARQTADNLQRILDTMDPRRRAVFVLFELEGESCASIAAGLGIKLGTVYSRLHEARRTFIEQEAKLP